MNRTCIECMRTFDADGRVIAGDPRPQPSPCMRNGRANPACVWARGIPAEQIRVEVGAWAADSLFTVKRREG